MTESLVLLTPLLVLLLVAMFGFLGCAGVWGLDPVVPGVPVLSATAGNARVNLSWRTSQPLGGFRLMKGTESGALTMLAEVDSNTFMYEDSDVVNDTTYYYVVVNLGGTGSSDDEPSNEVAVRPQAEVINSFITSSVPGSTASASGFFGMAIVVGPAPVTVKALGRGFVVGNTQLHIVKIVDTATGMDVPNGAAAVFTAGGAAGEIRYAALATPVVLNADSAYYIVSQEMTGGDRFFNHDTSVMTTAVATVRSAVRGSGTVYTEDSGPGVSYALVDFQY
jgi:hypothetical protein